MFEKTKKFLRKIFKRSTASSSDNLEPEKTPAQPKNSSLNPETISVRTRTSEIDLKLQRRMNVRDELILLREELRALNIDIRRSHNRIISMKVQSRPMETP
ncbi:hypothetical protein HK098_007320 [Nowakowskiella sp. JEL0407]|nr:hypothetical protein HK098_007320 [Nowakowskiella sp. JEL0407]